VYEIKKHLALTVVACLYLSRGYCQSQVRVENVEFKNDSHLVTISYQLISPNPRGLFFVECEVYEHTPKSALKVNVVSQATRISTRELTGDIGIVEDPGSKTIFWDFRKDGFTKNTNIQIKVAAKIVNSPATLKTIALSTAFPGLGSLMLTGEKKNMALGLVGYGFATGAVLIYSEAKSIYRSYKVSADVRMYEKADSKRRKALYFAGAAIATWGINYLVLAHQTVKNKKATNWIDLSVTTSDISIASSRVQNLYYPNTTSSSE
jgi:hypothetical protein